MSYTNTMIKRYLRRFPHLFAGIWYAIRHDFGFQTQLGLVGPAILVFVYLFWPLSKVEILFLGLAYALILITELQNTAFEHALDRLHPERHEKIGHSKDMAGGSVLLAGFFLVFVMTIILFL